MAPKANQAVDKARAQAMAKKIEDKTFGMKNKNKSKSVQATIAQMKAAAGVSRPGEAGDRAKKEAANAINDVLFKEALSKKDIAKRALEKLAAKELKEKEKNKEPDKRDIYTDTRDTKELSKEEDDMANWDDEKLAAVVNSKKGGQGERVKTDIICKLFVDAVEKRTYGWFWECPNGGDKCQYRHALPEGFVLKRDRVDMVQDEGPSLEDQIEDQRKALKTRTPVTFERLQDWLAKKKAAILAKEEEELDAARKQYAKGKVAGVTGRMLFSIDASLFVDDAGAGADTYVREDSDDEDDSGGGAVALAARGGGGYLGNDEEPQSDADGSSGAPGIAYDANYATDGGSVAAAGSGSSAAVDITDLSEVDESLFLDEDLPDDDELE